MAFADSNPITDGHMVVIPRKHVGTIYELSAPEQEAIWELVSQVRSRLITGLRPHAFSIGFNDTLHSCAIGDHAAVHVVPRWRDDSVELMAGLEWVTDDGLTATEK